MKAAILNGLAPNQDQSEKQGGANLDTERTAILKMVQDGKITVEEASKLLAAVDEPTARPAARAAAASGAKFLRVRVIEEGGTNVNVNLPIALIEVALKLGMKFIPEGVMSGSLSDVDLQQLMDAIQAGATGKLVEVQDGDTQVEVYVE